MGRFIIFLLSTFALSLIGLAIWWIWNKVHIAIERQESVFDIEKETHNKMKEEIKEEK